MNRLSDLIMNAIAEDTPSEVTADHLDQVMEQRRRMYDQIESSLCMPLRYFDKAEAVRVSQMCNPGKVSKPSSHELAA